MAIALLQAAGGVHRIVVSGVRPLANPSGAVNTPLGASGGLWENRFFFWRENIGYLNIRSDILILREKLFHILESAQPRFINAFRRSKRNVTVYPPHAPPARRQHITSILLFEIPKPFINRGWAESTL